MSMEALKYKLYLYIRRQLPKRLADYVWPRDYALEYRQYESLPERRAATASRKRARRMMAKKGMVKKGDGKQVHHIDSNPRNNKLNNLVVLEHCAHRKVEGKECHQRDGVERRRHR